MKKRSLANHELLSMFFEVLIATILLATAILLWIHRKKSLKATDPFNPRRRCH